MYCPKCKSEYRKGFNACSDCHVALVEQLPEETKEEIQTDSIQTDNIKTVKIMSVSNEVEAGLIMNLLMNNNIPCYKKSVGSGGYMNIYMGYSIFGEEIYVSEQDVNKANELLNDLTSEVEEVKEDKLTYETDVTNEVEVPYEMDVTNKAEPTTEKSLIDCSSKSEQIMKKEVVDYKSDNTSNKIPFYKNPQKIARMILILYIVIMILSMIVNKIIS